VQNNFSLLNRRFGSRRGLPARIGQPATHRPLAGGVLSGKYQTARPAGALDGLEKDSPRTQAMSRRFLNERTLESTARFGTIARDAGMSVATLAIAWSLAHDFVGSTIIGATHADQLTDTLAAADQTVADVLAACNECRRRSGTPWGRNLLIC
jgi:aryl-alcohol dehydrogenase-like predicted oxidoreductase